MLLDPCFAGSAGPDFGDTLFGSPFAPLVPIPPPRGQHVPDPVGPLPILPRQDHHQDQGRPDEDPPPHLDPRGPQVADAVHRSAPPRPDPATPTIVPRGPARRPGNDCPLNSSGPS